MISRWSGTGTPSTITTASPHLGVSSATLVFMSTYIRGTPPRRRIFTKGVISTNTSSMVGKRV